MNVSKILKTILIIFLVLIYFKTNDVVSQDKNENEAKGLNIGDSVINFTANDQNEVPFSLYETLKKGPVVIVFYRGQWCPVCNRHLSQIQDSLQHIYDKGATLVAVSPEQYDYLKKNEEKTNARFTLLFDEGYKISNLFDVTFLPNKVSRISYNTALGAKLKEAHSDDSERLPIPATFIINTDGKIVWRHFDPDYKERASVKDIVENIPVVD